MTATLILESVQAPLRSSGVRGRWRARLIEADVMGSSGYYSAEVLRRDGPAAFRAGTHIYLDHATASEDSERPERSVRDLAGALIEDASYEDGPDGKGLFARVQFFPDHIERVEAMAEVMPVELSIRAAGTIEESESGRIVTSIVGGLSVDIVTHAGAGGRLVKMTESRTPQVAQLSEADRAGMQKLFDQMAETSKAMSSFVTALTESKAAETKAKEDEQTLSYAEVVGKLTESGLPAVSQKRIAEAYKPGYDIDKAIIEEKDFVESVRKESGIKNDQKRGTAAGKVETADDTATDKNLKEAADAFAGLWA